MASELSKDELHLIAQLLEMASEQFSNHGCNDFKLPATKENKAMLLEMVDHCYGEEDKKDALDRIAKSKKTIMTFDWMLMSYLAKRCRKLSND